MATTATDQTRQPAAEASLRWGSWLRGIAAAGFIGYAVALVRTTDSFLELGIGPHEVPVGATPSSSSVRSCSNTSATCTSPWQASSPPPGCECCLVAYGAGTYRSRKGTGRCKHRAPAGAKCGEATDGWVRHLRVGRPRTRPQPPAHRLRPLLHATVRRLRAGRRPLHLRVAA